MSSRRASADELPAAAAITSAQVTPENGVPSTSQTVPGSGSVPFTQYAAVVFRVQRDGGDREACYIPSVISTILFLQLSYLFGG